MAKLPLEGIRVVDLTVVWAGPYGTMMLGDLGAEVIRVESIHHFPPVTRGWTSKPISPAAARAMGATAAYPNWEATERHYNRTSLFNNTARNKLSMTVNILRPQGMEIYRRLVEKSDLIVENQSAGTMDKLGIGYATVSQWKPDIIMISSSGLGQTGPYKHYHGFGTQFEAEIGHTMLTGYPDLDPSAAPHSVSADAAAGASIAAAAIMALHYRHRTGKGQYVDLSQGENFLNYIGEVLLDRLINGRTQGTLGNRHRSMAPYGCYPCAGEDRWITIAVGTDEEWAGLCQAMGKLELIDDARFADAASRYQNQDELDAIIIEWTILRQDYELFHLLQHFGVAAAPVANERDCYADPHLWARGFFERVTQRDCGTHWYPGMLWKMSEAPGSIRLPPVCLGEHNEYVYKEILKVSDEEYAELVREQHIGDTYLPHVP